MEPWNKSLSFIFPTTYVNPQKFKPFSHWPSKGYNLPVLKITPQLVLRERLVDGCKFLGFQMPTVEMYGIPAKKKNLSRE